MSLFSSFFYNKKLSNRSQIHFDLAEIYYNKGRYEKALEEINQVTKEDIEIKKVKELREIIIEELEEAEVYAQEKTEEIEFTVEDGSILMLRMNPFDFNILEEKTSDNFYVESVNHGHEWVFVLRKIDGTKKKQKYKLVTFFNSDTFSQNETQKFYVTQAASDGEQWFFVLEENEDWEEQFWIMSPEEFPKEELKLWESNAYFINLLLEKDNIYFATAVQLVNKKNTIELEYWEEPINKLIAKIWDDEKWVERLFEIGEGNLYYETENALITDQSFLTDATFPVKELKTRLEEGHFIKQIWYANENWMIITQRNQNKLIIEDNKEDITEVLKELEVLIGLKKVKQEFYQLVDFLEIGKLKESQGIHLQKLGLHMVFSGNPGTGKTTVARLVGRVLKSLGLLSKGHIVETDRSGLVGQYVGQTAQKTNQKLDEAMGGILFVDEAYALKSEGKSDFGDEAIETILKRMEDERDKFIVVFAGYPNEMEELIESNPGLKSRFNTYLNFEDFTAEELVIILKKMLIKSSHVLSLEAEKYIHKYLQFLSETSDRYFGNAREVRNLFEDLLKSQSSRLAKINREKQEITYDDLREIQLEDIRNCYSFDYEEPKEESLDDILAELNDLIGLENIKQEIEEMARYIEIIKRRKESGLMTNIPGMHSVFIGAPGTGKTTVARILARIFKALGIIKKNVLVEASRQDLVAEYVGQTAIKTNKLIDKAMHGILFIDEAYALTSRGQNDFGQEAIEVLLKRMEDDRDKFVVIVAGYVAPMKNFLESNPGLPSRFNRNFFFPNFNQNELEKIFFFFLKKSFYVLDEDAQNILNKKINEKIKDTFFGNARWIRKLFEAAKISQAQRLSNATFINEEDLKQLTKEDLSNAFHKLEQDKTSMLQKRREIGF